MVSINPQTKSSEIAHSVGYKLPKRAIDIVGSLLGLIVAAPFMAVIALAIRVDSRGPATFAQWRAGRDGKPFRMYKFRTMITGAEELRAGLVQTMCLEEPVLKFHPDPRITRVGRFLRRWSLDELPQFANVLKGEMSLVGPRPEELHVVAKYTPWHMQRLGVTPGITGPMQVSGRARLLLDERVRLDLDYINHPSTLEDAKILARTIQAVIAGDGSY